MSVTPVSSGEVLSGFNVTGNKDLAVFSGGTALSTDIFGGTMTVLEGGYAEETNMVSGYGSMNVAVSGVVNKTRVGLDPSMSSSYYSSMYMNVSGSANSTTLYSAGTMFVRGASANVTDTTISSGGRMIMSDGVASNITQMRGGSASIQGGVVNGGAQRISWLISTTSN